MSWRPALSNLGEGLDLHQKIRANQLRHWERRTFRRRRAEIALAQIGVFVEFDRLCDVAVRKNNVLDRSAAGIEAGTDVLANLFDLRLQIAFAHNVAGLVARDLATDDDPMATIAQRDLGRGRRSGARRPDDLWSWQIFDGLPILVGLANMLLRVLLPYLQQIAVVRQIELPVDDGPSFGIDRVLVRRLIGRRSKRAVAVVLRCVMLRISRKEIAVLAAGKAPAQSVPRILEFGLALNGFSISKISDRVVATNREPRFIAPRRAGEESREQEREQLRAPRQSKKRSSSARLPPES